ncbi:MAG: prepilin-type N-terminal cleavage/methylation domain-containing protein [Candidatus Peregrinibacteria bacterium]
MSFKSCKKKGFTLVELLVVMSIVGVLSMLAVNGYTQYRRSTLLDLSADNIVSQLYEFKDKTLHGNFGGEKFEEIKSEIEAGGPDGERAMPDSGAAKCYGVYFKAGELPRSYELEYSGKKTWDEVFGVFEDVKCGDDFNPADPEAGALLELDEAVSIEDIKDFNGNHLDDFKVLFIPPDGEVLAKSSGNVMSGKIVLTVKYGVSDESQFKRNITIDLKSGTAEVSYFE